MTEMTPAMLRAMHRAPALREPGQPAPVTPPAAPKARQRQPRAKAGVSARARQVAVFIPCNIPTVTAHQKGAFAIGGKVRFFKKKIVRDSEKTFAALFAPFAPVDPMQGPLSLTLRLVFNWRKAESKKRRATFLLYPIETRPDCSNLVKTIEDVLTALRFWNDDGQVASLAVSKHYGDKPGIGLTIVSATATNRAGEIVSP